MSDVINVFLSHNSQDKPAVRELAAALRKRKLRVWLDEDNLRPGIPWQKLLEDGIRSSASIAVLIGKDGLGPWEDEEMQTALRMAVKDQRPVIPVILPDAPQPPELPMFLDNRTWVDLRPALSGAGLDKLEWGITGVEPNQSHEGEEDGFNPVVDAIITALVAGAAKSTTGDKSDDFESAYKSLKSYLIEKYAASEIEKIERDPEDDIRRSRLATTLRKTVNNKDQELKLLANAVIEQLANDEPSLADRSILDDPDGPLPVNLDIEAKIPLIRRFPVGPPVPNHLVPVEDLADILSDEINKARRVALIRRTEVLRLKHDPEGAKKAATVNIHELPDPDGGAYDFWFQAIDEACSKGPRTLASFLLSMPMGAWMRYGRDIFKTLEREYPHE